MTCRSLRVATDLSQDAQPIVCDSNAYRCFQDTVMHAKSKYGSGSPSPPGKNLTLTMNEVRGRSVGTQDLKEASPELPLPQGT